MVREFRCDAIEIRGDVRAKFSHIWFCYKEVGKGFLSMMLNGIHMLANATEEQVIEQILMCYQCVLMYSMG